MLTWGKPALNLAKLRGASQSFYLDMMERMEITRRVDMTLPHAALVVSAKFLSRVYLAGICLTKILSCRAEELEMNHLASPQRSW